MRALAVVTVLMFAPACITDPTVPCRDKRCPANNVCTPVGCATQEAVDACAAHLDGTLCGTRTIMNGACDQGVCHPIACGDKLVDPGEVCDDGNHVSGDGCEATCASNETCGNGFTDLAIDEECDEGVVGLSNDGCSSRCSIERPAWRDVSPQPIAGRYGTAIAGFSSRATLFGGSDGLVLFGDTWVWQGLWLRKAPLRSPPPRYRHAMGIYGGGTVLFGGLGTPTRYSDTWVWDGTIWTEQHPVHVPPARAGAAMTADHAGHIVMFGGEGDAGLLGDTWLWDGVDWTQYDPQALAPSPRTGHVMATDPRTGHPTILYGGMTATGPSTETWQWTTTGWVQLLPATTPPMSYGATLAFIGSDKTFWMFGGYTTTGQRAAGTWLFTSPDWSFQIATQSPAPRDQAAGTDDVIFGGLTAAGPSAETWVWDPSNSSWRDQGTTLMSAKLRASSPLVYDSRRGLAIQFGGTISTGSDYHLWKWDGINWSAQAAITYYPPARTGHALAYDERRDLVIVFGGGSPSSNDMWTWNGSAWSQLTPATLPPGRIAGAMTYDPDRDRVVLFGGTGTAGDLGDTWEWDGSTWVDRTSATGPSARSGHGLAYDRSRHKVVLFGGGDGDTWEWDGSAWKQITTTAAPPPRTGVAMAYDPARHRVVIVGGATATGELFDDAWEWDGGTWTELTTSSRPYARRDAALVYDNVRRQMVLVGGYGLLGLLGDTWTLTFDSAIAPGENCTFFDEDSDGDGLAGCADPDCWGRCRRNCPPDDACADSCGDGACDPVEDHLICPADCP